jgi:hypothetical protein
MGLGVGKRFVRQDLSFSGSSDLKGEYILGVFDYRLKDMPLIL